MMMSGRFAIVFGVEVRGKTWAVRVFTSKSPEREYRYSEISKYVNPVGADSPFVEFDYFQDGMRNMKNGKWYSFMAWGQKTPPTSKHRGFTDLSQRFYPNLD